jgi:hypothetical protein
MALSRTEHSRRRLAAERRKCMLTTGGAAVGIGLWAERSQAFGQGQGGIAQCDAAVLRFLGAAEIIETDLWLQYAELAALRTTSYQGRQPAAIQPPRRRWRTSTRTCRNTFTIIPATSLATRLSSTLFWRPKARSQSISISSDVTE